MAWSSTAPFGTDFNVTTPGRLIAGRQMEDPAVGPVPKRRAVGGKSSESQGGLGMPGYSMHSTKPITDKGGFEGGRYSPLPPIVRGGVDSDGAGSSSPSLAHGGILSAEDSSGKLTKNRPLSHKSDATDTDKAVYSAARSYPANVIVSQLKLCPAAALNDLENRFRRLPHDHRDCIELEDVLRCCRQSSVRLSTQEFTALLRQFDDYRNGTVPTTRLTAMIEAARTGGRLKLFPIPEQYHRVGGESVGHAEELPRKNQQRLNSTEPTTTAMPSHGNQDLRVNAGNIAEIMERSPVKDKANRHTAADIPARHGDNVHSLRSSHAETARTTEAFSPRQNGHQSAYVTNHPSIHIANDPAQAYSIADPSMRSSLVEQIATLQSNRVALERQRESIASLMNHRTGSYST